MKLKGISFAYDHHALNNCPFCGLRPSTSIEIEQGKVSALIYCPDKEAIVKYTNEDSGRTFYDVTFAIIKAEEKWNGMKVFNQYDKQT